MSARSVLSGIRPFLSHSFLPISEPSSRPDIATFIPLTLWLAMAFSIICFIVLRKGILFSKFSAAIWAKILALDSGCWISSTVSFISLGISDFIFFIIPIIWTFILSVPSPFRPIRSPGREVLIIKWKSAGDLSISIPSTYIPRIDFSNVSLIKTSALSKCLYLTGLNQRDLQFRNMPNLNEYGWTVLLIFLFFVLRFVFQDNRNIACSFQNLIGHAP